MFMLRDSTIVLVIHVLLAGLFVLAVLKDRFWPLPGVVTRGAASKRILSNIYKVAITLCGFILQAPDAAHGYSLALAFVDTAVLAYLCFINQWFPNKLLGLYFRLHGE
jgi:hypothetical protein